MSDWINTRAVNCTTPAWRSGSGCAADADSSRPIPRVTRVQRLRRRQSSGKVSANNTQRTVYQNFRTVEAPCGWGAPVLAGTVGALDRHALAELAPADCQCNATSDCPVFSGSGNQAPIACPSNNSSAQIMGSMAHIAYSSCMRGQCRGCLLSRAQPRRHRVPKPLLHCSATWWQGYIEHHCSFFAPCRCSRKPYCRPSHCLGTLPKAGGPGALAGTPNRI